MCCGSAVRAREFDKCRVFLCVLVLKSIDFLFFYYSMQPYHRVISCGRIEQTSRVLELYVSLICDRILDKSMRLHIT